MCTMSWDLSYSCSSSLAPSRTEQAWQKKCQTKSSPKPAGMWSQGLRLWKKGRESSQWWGTNPPLCCSQSWDNSGLSAAKLFYLFLTVLKLKLQPNVVLSKCKVMCLHCRSDVFGFFVHFSLIWSVAILLTDQTHCPFLLQCGYSSIYIYTSHGRVCACIGAQECIHLYIAHATVFAKL